MPNDVICDRCGRRLKHPIYLDGCAYGRTCFERLYGGMYIIDKKTNKVFRQQTLYGENATHVKSPFRHHSKGDAHDKST